jgi:hypothetical protein
MYLILKYPMHITRSSYLNFFDSLAIIKFMYRTNNFVTFQRDQKNLACCNEFYFVIDLKVKAVWSYVITET